jgi:lipopolysaccharide transport protein LptA
MKINLLLVLVLFLTGAPPGARAQKNFPEPAFTPPTSPLFQMGWSPLMRTNAAAGGEITEILSKRADFDLKGRVAVYRGGVLVKDPRMELACEILTVRLAAQSGQFESIIAETNVSVDFVDEKGQKVHGTGGRAIYTYNVKNGVTNDVVQLLDEPVLETDRGTWRGDVITLDRRSNTIRVTNSRMVIRQEPGKTNDSILSPIK